MVPAEVDPRGERRADREERLIADDLPPLGRDRLLDRLDAQAGEAQSSPRIRKPTRSPKPTEIATAVPGFSRTYLRTSVQM